MRKYLTLVTCLAMAACQASLTTNGPESPEAVPEETLQV